ncbi:hypothetical protein FQR65_LT07887 [Abscondita terminalis]|nr:hypothetical protein FQR65_LT07887 [Abscondita terminalis]
MRIILMLSFLLFNHEKIPEDFVDNDVDECIKELNLNREEIKKLDAYRCHPTIMKILIDSLLAILRKKNVSQVLDIGQEECIKELSLNREEIMKMDALMLPPDDNEDFNKFIVCDSKKKGLMSDDGKILNDNLVKLMMTAPELQDLAYLLKVAYETSMKLFINSCSSHTSSDPGKNMIRVYTCMYQAINKIKSALQ